MIKNLQGVSKMNETVIRKKIVFYGWVQGVGFRYRAYHAANSFGATGWVKNNHDGSVSMEIQGTEQQIDKVIIAIQRGTYVNIENMNCKTIPVVDGETTFKVN